MKSKALRYLLLGILGLLLGVLASGAGLLIWVSNGPRPADALTPYIEDALTPATGHYQVKIEKTMLAWAGWPYLLELQVDNLRLQAKEGATFARFPDVKVRLDILSLLIGKIQPRSLVLVEPRLRLFQNAEGAIGIAMDEEETAASASPPQEDQNLALREGLESFIRGEGQLAELSVIEVLHARVSVVSQAEGRMVSAPDTSIRLHRRREKVEGALAAGFDFNGKRSTINLLLNFDIVQRLLTVSADVKDVDPLLMRKLFPTEPAYALTTIPISGSLGMQVDTAGNIAKAAFDISGGLGEINDPEIFEGPFQLEGFRLAGFALNNFSKAQFSQATLLFPGGTRLEASGTVARGQKDADINLDITGSNIKINDLPSYWPRILAPMTREWVTSRIKNGEIVYATAKLRFRDGDISGHAFPAASADVTLDIKGAELLYLPTHPKVTAINGQVHITGETLDASVVQANFMEKATLSNGKVSIPNLNADMLDIHVQADVEAPAAKMVEFIAHPDLNHAERFNLNPTQITGQVTGDFALDFQVDANLSEAQPSAEGEQPSSLKDANINYDIHAGLKDIAQQKFMKNKDIEHGNLALTLNNRQLTLKGDATINKVPATLDLTSDFGEKAQTRYRVAAAEVPARALPSFGYADLPFLDGIMGVEAEITDTKKSETSHVTLNLANANVKLPQIGFLKQIGVPATVTFVSHSDGAGDNVKLTDLKISSEAASASGGTLTVSKKDQKLISLSFDNIKYGKNDLKFSYEETSAGYVVRGSGASADATPFMKNNREQGKEGFGFSDVPAVDIQLDVGQLVLGEEKKLEKFNASLQCDNLRCHTAKITGLVDTDNPFSFGIGNENGKRSLNMQCNNAGALIKALDVVDNMQGGSLSLDGAFDDTQEGNPLQGRLLINDFALQKAPLLTKLLTLASLTGIVDTLSGKGIGFSKLTAPFSLHRDIISLKEAKAYGSAIGLTASGTLNLKTSDLNMEGTVVPSYTLNSFFQKIPILGILAGKEGEGLIAANYSIAGRYSEPSIRVNPLSMLTPGFLRGLFDIFDAPEKEKDGETKDKKSNSKNTATQ